MENQEHLGKRTLTFVHAVGQALAIGPIFSAGLLTSLIAVVSGYSTPLAVLLGSIGAIGLAFIIGVFAKRYAGAGAIYEYLTLGANPSFGIFSAGLYFIGSLFLGGGGIYIALGFFSSAFAESYLGMSIPFWLLGAIILLIVFLLNHYGVRLAIRGVLILACISAIPFILLCIVIIASGGADGNTSAVFTTRGTSINGIFYGILFAVTLFIGFEAAASIAEESHMPRKSIPVAVITAVVVSALFYILVTYAAAIGFGHAEIDKGAWANAANPIASLAEQYVGYWLAVVIDLVIILDMISVAIAIMVTCSRGFFALSRDHLLPKWISKTSRHGTPLAGNLIGVGFSAILLIWAAVARWGQAGLPDALQSFFITTAVGSYLIELIYLFLAVAALRLVWKDYQFQAKHLWRYVVIILGLLTPILAFRGSIVPFPEYPNSLAVYIALIIIALVAVWTIGMNIYASDKVKNAALHGLETDINAGDQLISDKGSGENVTV
ncbi:APC family permease [Ferviditalea candida]|uniref:APC family permease n=1 Tax=Ferviditalea candida TaxID=3108399 RepID=A0ABU5ZMD4_9BACL|nr:APC family permease [Paenibacillaceae bacterium T2]